VDPVCLWFLRLDQQRQNQEFMLSSIELSVFQVYTRQIEEMREFDVEI